MRGKISFLLACLLYTTSALAQRVADDSPDVYLNKLREAAGMNRFSLNSLLLASAQKHAEYLVRNRSWGHSQSTGRPGFSGRTPMERMLAAGYNNRHGSENVSTHRGNVTAKKSVDGLMGAIYHRFAFLSFDHDQVGIGHAMDNSFHSYVFNLGNSRKEMLCNAPAVAITEGQYFFKICNQEDKKLRKADFDQAVSKVRKANADFVVWPYDKATQIRPAFYEESPDPLPGIEVSGYPVSLQFNPDVFARNVPRVSRFELFRLPEGESVKLATYFNKNSDINRKFTDFEHAIFPLHRLRWNTAYRAEVDYLLADNQKRQISWEFRTMDFELARYDLLGGETIVADAKPFVVYMAPESGNDALAEYTLSYQGFTDVDVAIFDAHTLVIDLSGQQGEAIFDFHGRQFRVVK